MALHSLPFILGCWACFSKVQKGAELELFRGKRMTQEGGTSVHFPDEENRHIRHVPRATQPLVLSQHLEGMLLISLLHGLPFLT